MKPQGPQEAVLVFERARRAISMDNTVAGLAAVEKALALHDNFSWYSYLGYCVAKERGQVTRGVELCLESLEHEPNSPAHHLNLGKIYLVSGNRAEALRIFRQGMARGGSPELMAKLDEFGKRKAPLIPFLPRTNPVNKYVGLLLSRIGLR